MTDDQCPGRPQGKAHLWKDWTFVDGTLTNQKCIVCGEFREVTDERLQDGTDL